MAARQRYEAFSWRALSSTNPRQLKEPWPRWGRVSPAEQIIGMIKEQEAGMATAEVCRRHGLSPATFYKLKARYGGMDVSDAQRLRALE